MRIKQIAILCVIMMLISVFGSSVALATNEYKVDFTYQDGSLQFNGTLGQEGFLNFIIVPQDTQADDLLNNDLVSTDAFLYTSSTDNSGAVSGTVKIDEPKSGKYQVWVYAEQNKQHFYMFLSNAQELAPYLPDINQGNAENIATVLKNDALGWDNTLAAPNAGQIAALLLANRPETGYTAESFCNAYMLAETVVALIKTDSVNEILPKYLLYIGADTITAITELSQSNQAVFQNLLKNHQPKSETLGLMIEQCLYMTELLAIDDYDLFGKELLRWISASSYSLGDYDRLSSEYEKVQVMQDLYRIRRNYLNMEALYQGFLALSGDKYNSSQGGSGAGESGGSSGSGNSGGGGVAVIGNNNVQPISETFTDISGHWAETVIVELSKQGVVNGYDDGSFRPEAQVTRAEFVKMLLEVLGEEPEVCDVFADIQNTDWFAGYVGRARKLELIQGDNTNFYPNREISREDAAVIIMRALKGLLPAENNEIVFADEDNISEYAISAVKTLHSYGIINGSNGCFFPKETTTRAESAALLYRTADLMKGR